MSIYNSIKKEPHIDIIKYSKTKFKSENTLVLLYLKKYTHKKIYKYNFRNIIVEKSICKNGNN